MKRLSKIFYVFLILTFLITNTSFAQHKIKKDKVAILLAAFGTSYPEALKAIINIENNVKKAFPNIPVKLTFTSNIIREIWHKRQNDPKYINVPKEILYIKSPLSAISELQEEGYKTIIVQPLHLYSGEEYMDLKSYIEALNSIKTIKKRWKPFKKIVLGRPAFGTYKEEHDYHKDLEMAAYALEDDINLARSKKAALVYMGHGNEFFSTGVYAEFQKTLRKIYPDVKTYVGTVEGFPSLDDVIAELKRDKIKKVILKPLMDVAGDHARNDMAGDDPYSWKNVLRRNNIKVTCIIEGLGEKNSWAKIYIQHIKDAIKDNKIEIY